MKRRTFIVSSAACSAVIIPLIYSCGSDNLQFDKSIAEPLYLSMIWDTEKIQNIGENFIAENPKEKSTKRLVKKLLEDTNGNDKSQLEEVNNKVPYDFGTNKTIILDGWILSETEARQCALFSIQKPE